MANVAAIVFTNDLDEEGLRRYPFGRDRSIQWMMKQKGEWPPSTLSDR